MKIALSILCENPKRKTGLTTTYHEFVSRGLKLYPEISWLVFAGPAQEWRVADPRLQLNRHFPANDHLNGRLFADHFRVPAVARALGAEVMISTGFVPLRKCLPTAMLVFSLQHLDSSNRVGRAREFYRRWVMKYSWPKADLVITNSQFAASQILSVCPAFRDRLVQSYEGLQHEQFHPAALPGEAEKLKAQFGVGPGYFLWTSNFYPYKQADLLLKGYALLDQATRQEHPLVMVGGDWDNQLEANRALAQRLGIANEVRFLGWVGDEWLAPLYRHALAFCLASREETFGRCVIESMACGTPCLVNDIAIMREVTDGHALIVDFKDTARVAGALRSLVQDPELRARLRLCGIERARHFTFENFTTERIDAIKRFLCGKAGR